ncbi:NAD-dependent epimerase/dehydratase family protein [Allosalinactinospora lopnorensis]|uniref:NAD-dependent epimerase/dehydratase family protein n=1 Tax=Allosalinactinospora lopnorensis TaxID=1352348 RepID=UPI000623F14B|nr:NAD(P)-dependent oxidoreductase [Allosalinactinospora lopnorensis]
MTSRRVLLTGAAGFVGSAIARRLARTPHPVRALVHRRALPDDSPLTASGAPGTEVVRADLTRPATLTGICDGVHTVVHAASAVDAGAEVCRAVNERGTRALLAEASRAGVRHVVYISTAAVYGAGPHRGIAEDALPPAPETAVSRSRLAAERMVLSHGGTVFRPMFVYGPGDVWFVPTLAALARFLPKRVNGGTARLSTIAVDALADVTAAAAESPGAVLGGAVYHVNHPEAVPVGRILDSLSAELGLPRAAGAIAYQDAVQELGLSADMARRLALVSFDHFYDSTRIWAATGVAPGAPFPRRFPEYADWYRRHLERGG